MQDRELMWTERLREILKEEKQKLWDELHAKLLVEQEWLREQFDNPGDIGDQSMLDVLSDTGIAVADILREKLTQIEVAEQKLSRGSYGICEDCGREIDEERLRAVPYAERCVTCQELFEGPSAPPGKTL